MSPRIRNLPWRRLAPAGVAAAPSRPAARRCAGRRQRCPWRDATGDREDFLIPPADPLPPRARRRERSPNTVSHGARRGNPFFVSVATNEDRRSLDGRWTS